MVVFHGMYDVVVDGQIILIKKKSIIKKTYWRSREGKIRQVLLKTGHVKILAISISWR